MEEKLSAIENGSLSIKDIISDTKDFVSSVINNTDVRKYAKEALFNRDHPCPKCHEGYLHKLHSKKLERDFYKCSDPECNFMCNVKKNGTPDYTICPECKTGFIITRKATKGDTTFEFRACSNYPECKYIEGKNKPQPKGPKCPKCGEGVLITRKGEKDGKKWQFKGCSNYPKCDYKEWGSGKKSK
nr:topoisomerase DNA-binding C4 zinc finger domain-containing protein [Veillonella parvula]